MPTKSKQLDPDDIRGRTYKQSTRLLDLLEDPEPVEELTVPQLISCLKLLIAYDLTAIRKFARDDEPEMGSAVRKYSKAFEQNAGRGQAKGERAKAALHVVSSLDDDDGEGDGPAA